MKRQVQRGLSVAAITAALVGYAAGSARANVVWSEDWNPNNFTISGTVTDGPVGDLTDRSGWLNVSYNVFSAPRRSARMAGLHGLGFPRINSTTGPSSVEPRSISTSAATPA